MNSNQLLDAIGEAKDQYVLSAVESRKGRIAKHSSIKKPLMVAAIVVLTLALVGCAAVYVLHMQDMKVGDQEVTTPMFNEYLEFQGNATIPQQVLSLAGVKGSSSYQAAQEWFAFKQSYDPDHEIRNSVWGKEPEFPSQYDAYGPYTQEMVDKLDEIAASHNLKLQGAPVKLHGGRRFYEEMGIDGILMPDSRATVNVQHAYAYENGSWGVTLFFMNMPEEEGQWPYRMTNSMYYNKKDCLSTDLVALDDTGDWVEWNYTTASGQNVLLMMSRSDYAGWIICDREDAMISVRVTVRDDVGYNEDGKQWFDSTYMSNKQFEQVADAIDFNMNPVYQGEAVSTVDRSAMSQTGNGYTIRVKSVKTDGYSAIILLGVTGPEGVPLTQYDLCNKNWGGDWLTLGNGFAGSASSSTEDDFDGLDNTQDILIRVEPHIEEGVKMPITADSVWNLYFEDLVGSQWMPDSAIPEEEILAEGVWNFDITFENGDFREIELIQEPVKAQVNKGWNPKTGDIYEETEVTSFKLRSLSATIIHSGGSARIEGKPGQEMYVVMKDGSKVEIFGGSGDLYTFMEPVDLSLVDFVQLANGTRLPIPELEEN